MSSQSGHAVIQSLIDSPSNNQIQNILRNGIVGTPASDNPAVACRRSHKQRTFLKQLTGFTLQNEFISCRSINQQRMNIGNVVLEFVSLRKQHQMGNIKTRLSWQPYLTTKL